MGNKVRKSFRFVYSRRYISCMNLYRNRRKRRTIYRNLNIAETKKKTTKILKFNNFQILLQYQNCNTVRRDTVDTVSYVNQGVDHFYNSYIDQIRDLKKIA